MVNLFVADFGEMVSIEDHGYYIQELSVELSMSPEGSKSDLKIDFSPRLFTFFRVFHFRYLDSDMTCQRAINIL